MLVILKINHANIPKIKSPLVGGFGVKKQKAPTVIGAIKNLTTSKELYTMTQLIASMRTKAIDKSNFGTTAYTCWELLDSTDVVIDITATSDAVFFEATNGEWEIFVADNIEWFVWELESRLQ